MDINSRDQLFDTRCMKFHKTLLFAHGNDAADEPYSIALGYDRLRASELPPNVIPFGCYPRHPMHGAKVIENLKAALQADLGKL